MRLESQHNIAQVVKPYDGQPIESVTNLPTSYYWVGGIVIAAAITVVVIFVRRKSRSNYRNR